MIPSDNQKQSVGLRIKEARSALGLTQKELCDKTGMPLQSLRGYELSHRTPGGDAIEYLVRIGINANWLLTGEGSMLISEISASEEADGEHAIYIDHYVDVRGSAGPGAEVPHEEVVVKARIDGRLLRERIGNGFASIKLITVSGDSMEPTLLHGDQVMVDTSCMDFVDDAIYAIQQNGYLRIKRIKLKLDGSIIVSSDNSTHNGPETYSADEAQHFKVVGKIIPFKFGRFKV